MRGEKNRSFLPMSLVLALLVASAIAVLSTQEVRTQSVRATNWSDPATWPNKKVPAAGDKVIIGKDKHVVLDISPPALGGLSIDGKLSFSNNADLELTTEWIMLHGELAIGTEGKPHTRKATITLSDNVKGEEVMVGMGDRGIMIAGGTLNLHGSTTNTWSKLSATANAGATSIQVLDARGWKVGDEIVLASTDFDPRQAERRTITSIRGNTITLDRKLDFMHFGKITFGVDERGEVGLLTRNIKIQASADAAQAPFFGGHIMAMGSSTMFVEGVELNRMGQNLTLARYPIHWHLVGDAKGQYIKNAAIHDTYNRCVTVHGTNFLRVENNVTYNTVGHCFFLEDGIEHGNEFIKNLAIQTKCHTTLECVPTNLAANGERGANYANRQAYREMSFNSGNTLLPSDNTVASYWITNPDNSFIDNVAAGSDENGFWLSLPEHPQGAFKDSEVSKTIWPRRTPLRAFRGNVAHSNFDGFMFDRNIYEDNTFGLATIPFLPLTNPADLDSEVVETHFESLTSYKNRNGGLWSRGDLFVFSNLKLADNAIGMTPSAGDIGSSRFKTRLVDSLVVGETDNSGNPTTPEEVAYGRSLPKRRIPDFPIRGYEYYDYRDDVVNTTFVNFQDNDRRKTGALSWLLFASSGVSTGSTISGAKFVNAKPVYFPKIDSRFDNDNRGGVGYRTLSIHDLDGSVTGVPDSHIMLHDGENDSVVTDDSCVIHPTWNASVCTGDVGRLNLSDSRGELPGTVNIETRTARFAFLSTIGGNRPAAGAPPAARGGAAPGAPAARGGAAPAGRGGARGGRGAAAQQPIVLSRNGKDFKITGNQSTVRAGTEILVKTERQEVTLSLAEMDQGAWVIFELPGFTKAASGTEQSSTDALRKANATSYFRGGDALWVKLVVTKAPLPIVRPTDLQASIAVSR
ncbi:MAG TPA: G8 domain-containing protein [Vicinamibacterales bacterium]|nr:G8 domain-containing protein [Vicinamibacterales bacterium]